MRLRLLTPVLALAVLAATPTAAGAAQSGSQEKARVERAAAQQAGADEVDAAKLVVTDLKAEVERTSAELTEGTRKLEQGRAHLADVRLRATQVRRAADAATAEADAARARLNEVVGEAYRTPRPDDLGLALSAAPMELRDLVLANAELDHVQGNQQDLLREATAKAVAAQTLVQQAEQLEAEAQAQAQALRVQVKALRKQAQQTQDALEQAFERLRAAEAERRADLARTARKKAALKAAQKALALAASGGEDASGGGATCERGSIDGYANGFLPAEALCPLMVGSGHRLQAEAAKAFNKLFEKRALCVTDSYRSYAAQVSVFARKPGLAAVPGTSNHGLGLAVDLCGGVERFGSEAYEWMKKNAQEFGFIHPSWAEPGGSKPEPWHWEYVGS